MSEHLSEQRGYWSERAPKAEKTHIWRFEREIPEYMSNNLERLLEARRWPTNRSWGDHAKMPVMRIIDKADLTDTSVFFFCFGIVVGIGFTLALVMP